MRLHVCPCHFIHFAVPTQRYRNLFGSSNNNNSKSHSPAKSSSSASSSSKANKSPVKKHTAKNASTQKRTTSAAASKPKTLELALRNITWDDFAAQLEQVKLSCPGSELRWLSHVCF